LLNPVLDLSAFNTQSYQQYGSKGFGLTREKMEGARDLYVGGKDFAGHPYISPLLAKDFSGLPPVMIVTSAYDPLRDEGERNADLLSTAGVCPLWFMSQGFTLITGERFY
jgi:acetyl esterase